MATTAQKKSALAAIEKIDGWLSTREAMVLFDEAARATGPIVEIGSWRGRSTAALALGSMSGGKQSVYAIDSFEPVLKTVSGEISDASDADTLRRNLDGAGVNGLVKIVAKSSEQAAPEIPECYLLFVDGSHDYESVKRDLLLYLPKVKLRGRVIIHDCHDKDPGVVAAVEELLKPDKWRCRWRVDTSLVFERRNSIRHSVLLGFPGSSMCYGAATGLMHATMGAHDVTVEQSGMGWDDMNRLWVWAINQAARGKITHFAMLHSDITPSPGWIDLLLDEMDDRDADMISAVAALKNDEGLTSCGIGDKSNPWAPYRRFTVRELMEMPETFGIADTEHPDRYLLHNSGCWVADMRKRLWRTVNKDGILKACFAFPIRARLQPDGDFLHERESEDWYFSRMIADLGAETFATRRVSTIHFGQKGYRNDYAWGTADHDEATAERWRK